MWRESPHLLGRRGFKQDININPDDPHELDNNNYKARPITIVLTPPPDLVVTNVTPLPQAYAGNNFSVSWTVQNQGAIATQDNSWVDTIYLSDSPTLNAPNAKQWLLGQVEHNGSLDKGNSYTGHLDSILSPAAAGKYIIVETNSIKLNSRAWEGPYTNNNILSTPSDVTNTPADLIVKSVKTLPQNFSGERTTVEWTVENIGGAMWAGTRYWYDEVWVSPDLTFIPERATKVGFFAHSSQQPLGAGESYTQAQEITLPKGIDGNYYIYVSTDYSYDRLTSEFRGEIPNYGGNNDDYRKSFEYRGFENPSNNLAGAPIPVTYREPDLRVTNLIVPMTPPSSGEIIPVTWTVTNIGSRDTRESSWIDRVYLSRDSSLDKGDTLLGSFTRRGALSIGTSYTQTQNFALPDGIGGDFHLLVFTDSNINSINGDTGSIGLRHEEDGNPFARVPEFQDEGNNITAAPLHINLSPAPDLQVTSVAAPVRLITGQFFSLTYTVTNTGTGDTAARQSNWDDLIYLSRDAFLDLQSDRYLGYADHQGGLAAGESYTITKTLTVPTDLTGPLDLLQK